jgi:hypothetical protein
MAAARSCTVRNEKFVQVLRIASDYAGRTLDNSIKSRDRRVRSF